MVPKNRNTNVVCQLSQCPSARSSPFTVLLVTLELDRANFRPASGCKLCPQTMLERGTLHKERASLPLVPVGAGQAVTPPLQAEYPQQPLCELQRQPRGQLPAASGAPAGQPSPKGPAVPGRLLHGPLSTVHSMKVPGV